MTPRGLGLADASLQVCFSVCGENGAERMQGPAAVGMMYVHVCIFH